MKSGIAPDVLIGQVKNTAGWLWAEPRAKMATDIFDRGARGLDLLLAAHWATVATFVPTDVDARIRHHVWAAMNTPEELAAACTTVDEVASWDARIVSERVDEANLSGHDGEWLAVRAGALGRAVALNAQELVEKLATQIDEELDREARIMEASMGTPQRALRVATIIAHNLGDLSRVVAEWPVKSPLQERWVRLGHPDAKTRRDVFVKIGVINKAIMAHENHRFLPLRKPRALRAARSLLLPIGPWFDSWGEAVAKSEHLEDRDRAEVLAALLEVHGRDDQQEGCLRAIAGLHRATKGGLEKFVPDLPARMRKDALRGKVRDALDIDVQRFEARLAKRFIAAGG